MGGTLFTSKKQCLDSTGISPEVLAYAFKHPDAVSNINGCKHQNRIHWDKLEPWIEANKDLIEEHLRDRAKVSGQDLKDEKTREEIRKLKNFNKSRDEAYISRKLVLDTVSFLTARLTESLRQKLEYELPPRLAGASQLECKQILTKALDELLGNFKRGFKDWKTAGDIKEIPPEEWDV